MTTVLMSKNGYENIYVNSDAVSDHIRLGWVRAEIGYGKQAISMPDGSTLDISGQLNLVDTYWDDLRFPVSGINPPGAVSDPALDTTDGRLSFSATATNMIAIQVQMSHSWKEGTSIIPHLHWSPTSSNTGNVKWELQYKIANVNDVFPASWTTITVLSAGSGVADTHQIGSFGEVDMTGKTLSCMILMLISRLGADPQDTYSAACKLNEVDIHYQIDAIGSDAEYTKVQS